MSLKSLYTLVYIVNNKFKKLTLEGRKRRCSHSFTHPFNKYVLVPMPCLPQHGVDIFSDNFKTRQQELNN